MCISEKKSWVLPTASSRLIPWFLCFTTDKTREVNLDFSGWDIVLAHKVTRTHGQNATLFGQETPLWESHKFWFPVIVSAVETQSWRTLFVPHEGEPMILIGWWTNDFDWLIKVGSWKKYPKTFQNSFFASTPIILVLFWSLDPQKFILLEHLTL